ncbi:MAG TPA: hypothetical protein GX707_03685 [Epulopiscium sp.]|nr:hypothetical protein [Candidatus Epulonipiscium sp.]
MDIYISPHRKTTVTKKKLIQLKDIAEISAPGHAQRQVENIIVFSISEDKKANYIIGVIDIIKSILKEFPSATISNEGEESVVLQFLPEDYKESKLWEVAKVAVVALTLFVGSTITIMAYHEDVSLVKVFISIQEMLTGVKPTHPNWIGIPYSIGIGVGIIVFYNQFGVIKLTNDPTPIQIEMNKYDTDIDACLVDISNRSPMKGNRNDIK